LVRASGRGNRVGSGDGRSKKLVNARRDDLRTRERWKHSGCRVISELRQIESRWRIDALTLACTHVTAIMAPCGGMFVAITTTTSRGRTVRGIVHRAVGVGRSNGCSGQGQRRVRHPRADWRGRRGSEKPGASDSLGMHSDMHIRWPFKRRLGCLQGQPHNQLERQQHKQCSFREQDFCETASHAEQLTPKTPQGDTARSAPRTLRASPSSLVSGAGMSS
jgi:hypothetical protein